MMNLETVAAMAAGRVLNWILGGLAITLCAEIVLRLGQRQNPRVRFTVWFGVLLTIVLLPLAASLVPHSPIPATKLVHAEFAVPAIWAVYAFVAWAIVALLAVARVGFGLWHVSRLRKRSHAVALDALDSLLQKRLQHHVGRQIAVHVSDDVKVPVALGFFRPIVVLPSWALKELSTKELDAVLLHEIAHIVRLDDWTNLVQRLLRAIFFFHPAVWWTDNRLSLEREMACDDAVLNQTSSPHDYARCLVSLAEKSFLHRGLALAQAAVTRMRQTTLRISQILDVSRPSARAMQKPAVALLAGFSLLTVFVASQAPELVAFQQAPTRSTVTAAHLAPSESGKLPATIRPASEMAHRSSAPLPVTASALSSQARSSIRSQISSSSTHPVALAARFSDISSHAAAPQLARVRVTNPKRQADAPQAYLLVVQTHYAPSGEIFWSIGVVQLTVFHPSKSQPESPAKSI